MPLIAIPAKLLREWLPEPMQYIGAMFAANCMLQGIFGALLMRRIKSSPAAILGGCLLFLFAPIFLWRIGHDTLTAQWLLLASLWLYTRASVPKLISEVVPWCAIVGIAALTHPYFPPMVLAFAAAYWIRRVVARERSFGDAAVAFASLLLTVLLAWYLSGALLLSRKDAPGGIELGIYSSNVLTFVDPAGYSGLLSAIPGVAPDSGKARRTWGSECSHLSA